MSLEAGLMPSPDVEPFTTQDGSKRLYRVSTRSNSKRLIFDAAELAVLRDKINLMLGGIDSGFST